MGRTSCRKRLLAPLLLLILTGAAAAPTADVLYRQAQAAFARGNYAQTRTLAANALKQLAAADSELGWRVRHQQEGGILCANLPRRSGATCRVRLLHQRDFFSFRQC